MFKKPKARVLVVGAGPAGLVCAIALEKRGISVDILDCGWRPSQLYCAVPLLAHSLDALDELGIGNELHDSSKDIDHIAFYENGTFREEINLASPSVDSPILRIAAQSSMEEALGEHLQRRFKTKIKWNHRVVRVSPEGKRVRVEMERLGKEPTGAIIARTEWVVEKSLEAEYELVIGADGYDSIVRQSLDTSWDEIGPPESWAVFETVSQDLGTSGAGMNDARLRVFFGDESTSMLWHLPGNRWQWAFQIRDQAPSDHPKSRLGFDLDRAEGRQRLLALIADRAPEFSDVLGVLVWSAQVSFERRIAGHLGAGRCWLVGDAAHVTTPLDVHSLDLELVEAKEVAEQVADVLDGKISLLVLDTLGRVRQSRWERLEALERDLVPGVRAAPWVARYRQHIARVLPARGAQLVLLADILGLEIQPVSLESMAPWPPA